MAQYPKKYKFYWKLFGNLSFLLDMENEQTQKHQNFISAQNFPEDPKKYQNQNFMPSKYDEHIYHFAMEIHPPPRRGQY